MAPGSSLASQFKLLQRSPPELRLLYVLNFLNAYRYFTMALVLPLIMTAEYGYSDVEAGGMYGTLPCQSTASSTCDFSSIANLLFEGTWGLLITAWGFVASAMVDHFGVRSTALFSTTCRCN